MKRIITLIFVSFIVNFNSNATVRYVNNYVPYPSGPATMHFVDFTSAQTAASAGDTIYIEGSPIMYIPFTVSKQLTIIGPGFSPTSYNGYAAKISGNVTIGINLSGVKLIGLYINGNVLYNNGSNNLTVKRCLLAGVSHAGNGCNISGLLIEENYMYGVNSYVLSNNSGGETISNLTFRNNLCGGGLQSVGGVNSGTSLVYNNVFSVNAGAWFTNSVSNLGISNNILISTGTNNFQSTGVSVNYNNNILYGSSQAWPNGVNYSNMNPSFVSVPAAPVIISLTQDYHLTAGSPAAAKGADGIQNTSDDIGLYGGTNNYTMTGDPAIPVIRQMQITNPVISSGTPLNVNFISTRKQ